MRLIAVSNAFSGGLAAFRKDGSAIATVTTGRITWLQLFDLNEDGVSEVVTEEVDGRGTGILTKSFAVYVVSSSTIKDTWRRESYFMEAPWDPTRPNADPPVQERRSFLRFDEGGTGRRASMTYLTPSPNGAGFGATVFEMTADSVRERPQAGR